MRLPILPNDFRPEYSPWFALQNIQFTKKIKTNLQVYAGIKNIFNFMPKNPIMRAFDPFDKRVNIDNPNGYTFDPSYNYAPLQARRLIVGVRYILF
jgi:outer membrane receptor for ferrienterochelin and colicins